MLLNKKADRTILLLLPPTILSEVT